MKYVILDNIRSNHNVGAIFRTCDGAGVDKLFLIGYTPAPVDRFGRRVEEIKKTSLGASDMVAWEKRDNLEDLINELKHNNVTVVAVELSDEAISLFDFKEPKDVAYIMGNEITGISKETLANCDVIVEIPMSGQKESLNVAVSTGIVLFQPK